MPELRINHSDLSSKDRWSREEPNSMAERELLAFVDVASELAGPDSRGYLREIWLDELACMECMPEPSSSDWSLVTEAAERRLAIQLIEMGLTRTQVAGDSTGLVGSGQRVRSGREGKSGGHDFSCILSVSAVIY